MTITTAKTAVMLLAAAVSLSALSSNARFPQMAQTSEPALLASAGPIRIGQGPFRIELQPTGPRSLFEAIERLNADQRLYIVIRDLRVTRQPGVPYQVFLDLPQGGGSSVSMAHLIGTLNFFGVAEAGRDFGASELFTSYDVTDTVRRLRERQTLLTPTTVTIAPVGIPVADSSSTLGRVELVLQ
jgi:hypothetical protein